MNSHPETNAFVFFKLGYSVSSFDLTQPFEYAFDVDADDGSFSFGFGIQLNAIKASITKSEKKFFGEKLVFNRAIWTVSFPNK